MKITICTSGSRGDCQPYIALGLGLKARGHDVVIATEGRMEGLVREFGLDFFKIAGDPTACLYTKEAQVWLREGKVMTLMKEMEKYIAPFRDQAQKDYVSACEGANIIVSAPLCMTQTFCVAEMMNVPWVPVILAPTMKTGDFPLFFMARKSLGRWLNKLTYTALFWLMWRNERDGINAWRQNSLGLKPILHKTGLGGICEDFPMDMVVACNVRYIPGEKIPADWPATWHVSGFLFVPPTPEEDVDVSVRDWMNDPQFADQPRPIYLGFGSMPAPNPRLLVEWAVTVFNRLKRRIVLCAGWSELQDIIASPEDEGNEHQEHSHEHGSSSSSPSSSSGAPVEKIRLPKEILLIKAAPHDWLFPRCSAIVHHCGVGTSAAALRSGTPSVPCPVMLDQPFNAQRLFEMGTASPPVPFAELTVDKLINSLKFLMQNEEEITAKAKFIADEINQEDGVGNAVKIVEEAKVPAYFSRPPGV